MLSWNDINYFDPLIFSIVITLSYIIISLATYIGTLYYERYKKHLKINVDANTRKTDEEKLKAKTDKYNYNLLVVQNTKLASQKSSNEKNLNETLDLRIKNKDYLN